MSIPETHRLPWGIKLISHLFGTPKTGSQNNLLVHRIFVLLITYLTYVFYHASRKPISVVKNELINCTHPTSSLEVGTCASWIIELSGVDEKTAQRTEGTLDSTFLIAYSIAMFFSGIIAERVNLRYFLATGMILSGFFTALFGLGKVFDVHNIVFYIFVQLFAGVFQTTGWPSVVTVVANWFGKGKKGLIFGIWNSHTSVGNILGSCLAGRYVGTDWAFSFIVPGGILAAFGFIIWAFLIVSPADVGIQLDQAQSVDNNMEIDPDEATVFLGQTEEESDALWINKKDKSLEDKPITFCGALRIPGVVEFSLALFFAKLVSYTFLFWLPTFIKEAGVNITSQGAAYLSIVFDLGGIFGGIMAGLIADYNRKSATTCAMLLILAIPVLIGYDRFGIACPLNGDEIDGCFMGNVVILFLTGLLVNGPYSLITTAVAADLGTHKSLEGSSKALATVTSVIDGTGSLGAAVGPFLAGAVGIQWVFFMLMAADVLALCLLTRLVIHELHAEEILERNFDTKK